MRVIIGNHDRPSAEAMADFLRWKLQVDVSIAGRLDELRGADAYVVVLNNVHAPEDEPRARVQRVIAHCAGLNAPVVALAGYPADAKALAERAGLRWLNFHPLEPAALLEAVRDALPYPQSLPSSPPQSPS